MSGLDEHFQPMPTFHLRIPKMTAQIVPALDFSAQIVDPRTGCLTTYGDAFLRALFNRTGGQSDKVEAASVLASGAVPRGTEVIAGGGLQVGGPLGGNVGLALYAAMDQVASLPVTGVQEGDFAYALDGLKSGEASGSGTGTPCWFSGGDWYAAWSGTTVAA